MALGAVATVAAVAALARESQLPDKLSEWDDQVKALSQHPIAVMPRIKNSSLVVSF